jgi:hypothetical protein
MAEQNPPLYRVGRMSATAILEKRMADLYAMFCSPGIVCYPDGRIEFNEEWRNEGARLLFEHLKEQLIAYNVELLKKQAIGHGLAPDEPKDWQCKSCQKVNPWYMSECLFCGSGKSEK